MKIKGFGRQYYFNWNDKIWWKNNIMGVVPINKKIYGKGEFQCQLLYFKLL